MLAKLKKEIVVPTKRRSAGKENYCPGNTTVCVIVWLSQVALLVLSFSYWCNTPIFPDIFLILGLFRHGDHL